MRKVFREVTYTVDDVPRVFQLKKLDAFDSVALLIRVRKYQREGDKKVSALLNRMFDEISGEELKELMKICLSAVSVKLPAGFQPVYLDGFWGWPDLEYESKVVNMLVIQEMIWSLEGFFLEKVSDSPSGT